MTRLLLAALAACAARSPEVLVPEAAPPDGPVHTYLDARDRCDPDGLRAAFHPEARLHHLDADGEPAALTQIAWWDRVRRASPCRVAERNTVRAIDRTGPLALFEVESRFADGGGFHDYLLVAETDDGWRIVDKSFARLAPGTDVAGLTGDDEAAIRAVMDVKIAARAAFDPWRLLASHRPDARYHRVHIDGVAFRSVSLSEAAAGYAERRDRGERDPHSQWRILELVGRPPLAATKVEVVVEGGQRFVDHLLWLQTPQGWRIAAAAWTPDGRIP